MRTPNLDVLRAIPEADPAFYPVFDAIATVIASQHNCTYVPGQADAAIAFAAGRGIRFLLGDIPVVPGAPNALLTMRGAEIALAQVVYAVCGSHREHSVSVAAGMLVAAADNAGLVVTAAGGAR